MTGRTLHVYDTGTGGGADGLALFWHHGTPGTGIRWVSYDRPGYGGSTRHPGRDVASAAADVAAVADALGIDRFAVLGSSGGGPHAVACAAVLPERVLAAVSMSGLAPFGAEGLDWFAGMIPSGAAEPRAATAGRAALEAYLGSAGFDPEMFTPADHAALSGVWSWLATVAGQGLKGDRGGMVDDDLAYVAPWGCDPAQVSGSVLLVHGAQDRVVPSSHGQWLAGRCRSAELWLLPDKGHVSVLGSGVAVLDWLREHAAQG